MTTAGHMAGNRLGPSSHRRPQSLLAMPELPRIAVGTIQPNTSAQPILWALMEALRRRGTQVQSFVSRACFPQHKAAEAITGLKPRFLDSWLMSAAICGEIFFRSSELGDLSLVEGDFLASFESWPRGC